MKWGRSKQMKKRYWLTSLTAVLMICAGSFGCGASAGDSANAGEEGNTAQTAQALTSGQNFGDCSKIKSNPCVTYNACGINFCNSQTIWCGPCQ
jgi:hypothetical protein